MTGRQKSKLAMFQAIESVCSQHRHVWNQLPAFREAFGCYQQQLLALTNAATAQRRHTGGAAQEKVSARQRLCVTAFEVAAAIRAAALASNDGQLAGKFAFSLTQLRIGKDQLCLERCRQVLTTAEERQAELQSFGVTSERIHELTNALDTFVTATEHTRTIRSANKSTTGQLPAAFRAVERILYDQLDNLMPQFLAAAPRFYNQYQENRVMKAPQEKTFTSSVTETEEPALLD